jgi:hypothetical protein
VKEVMQEGAKKAGEVAERILFLFHQRMPM